LTELVALNFHEGEDIGRIQVGKAVSRPCGEFGQNSKTERIK